MKKYGILLSAEEHKQLKTVAAQRGVLMQDIARDAVLAAIGNGDRPALRATTSPPADTTKLRRAAATARQLAKQLDDLAGVEPDHPETISMPIDALISMLMEVATSGKNAPAAEAAQAAIARFASGAGETDPAPEKNDRGAATDTRRSRKAAS